VDCLRVSKKPDGKPWFAGEFGHTKGFLQHLGGELEKIAPRRRSHPDVFRVRWDIYAAAKKWEAALDIATALTKLDPDDPFGWLNRSSALRQLNRWRSQRPLGSFTRLGSIHAPIIADRCSNLYTLHPAS
jgi:hypothetical protein